MAPRRKTRSGYWLRVPEEAYQAADTPAGHYSNITAYFRHEFNASRPDNLKLKISANSRYRLWVNGHPVTSGPCKGDQWRQYYDIIDVSQYLKSGFNCIGIKVIAYPAYASETEINTAPLSVMTNGAGPCLMVEGTCRAKKGKALADVTTGYADWIVSIDQATEWVYFPQIFWMGASEKVDGSKLPHGWNQSPELEGKWFKAQKAWLAEGDPDKTIFGLIPPMPLEERPIPQLYEIKRFFQRQYPALQKDGSSAESLDFPSLSDGTAVTLQPNGRYVTVLDAGELTTGFIRLNMKGGAGSTIRLRYSESFYIMENGTPKKGIRDDAENGVILGHDDVYYPSGGEEVYEPFWFRTFRFIQLEVNTGDDALTIEPPVYMETGYPLEVKTHVESSVPWVNEVWDISLRTLKRCMHETYEDCPYYEQLQYAMDTRSQILFTYMVSGDTRLAEKAMYDYRSSLMPNGLLQSRYPSREPQVIPTFNIFFILMVEDYYWQTGETKHIFKYRSAIDGILEWFNDRIGGYGLIENLEYWPFVDWVDGWKHGVPSAVEKGPATIHSLMYAAGLQSAARLNELTGRKHMATEYEKRSREILQQVENKCWSDSQGLFKEGPKVNEFSQHSQVWAVLTGLVKGKRAKSILKKSLALDDIFICSYSMKFYLLRALEMVNMYDRSEGIWDDWQAMLEQHLTTCPEDNVNMRSDCHGWSALALYEFTRCILGVKPIEPGWRKIAIKPNILSLPDFSGSIVTPKGTVQVSWKKQAGHFSIKGTVPDGVPFELYLPDGTKQLYLHGGSFEF
jgi:alpha-L-rhamnosidase